MGYIGDQVCLQPLIAHRLIHCTVQPDSDIIDFLRQFPVCSPQARKIDAVLQAAAGAAALDSLPDSARVLISEGCTHHRQCDDIGTVKLPGWIRRHTGKNIEFSFTSGTEFPEELTSYDLIVHCGGCMLNEREMKYRLKCAADQGVPMTNYGIAIAHMKGILKRSTAMFPEVRAVLEPETAEVHAGQA